MLTTVIYYTISLIFAFLSVTAISSAVFGKDNKHSKEIVKMARIILIFVGIVFIWLSFYFIS